MPPFALGGQVASVSGLSVEMAGLSRHLSVGDRLDLTARDGRSVPAEIVGFRADRAAAMAFGAVDGLGPGSEAALRRRRSGGHARRSPMAGSAA